MRKCLESGLVALIALTCAAFVAVLVEGPGRREESAMRDPRRTWIGRWSGAGGEEGMQILGRDQVLRLPSGGEGSSVRVEAGMVIVTREGDPEDHVLEAGAELRVPGRGLAVAWAQEPSRIEVRRCRKERPGETEAPARLLSPTR